MKTCLLIAKKGPAAFLSHLEWSKAIERSLRRSGLAVAMTQGFNRHFRISFNGALAVGEESNGEFVEVTFAETYLPPDIFAHLANELPRGMELGGILPIDSLPFKLIGNKMQVTLEIFVDFARQQSMAWLTPLADSFASDSALMIEVARKSGARQLILSDYLRAFSVVEVSPGNLKIDMEMSILAEGSIKAKEIIHAFWRYAGIEDVVCSVQLRRLRYRVWRGDKFIDPFAP
jgi:radical SAM-linked protein